jgi:DNA repair photolyase
MFLLNSMDTLLIDKVSLLRDNNRLTLTGRPITWYVDDCLKNGIWRQEVVPSEVVGLSRQLTIVRTSRKTNLITHSWHGDKDTFCPPTWWDLAIGSGACGLGCRACFLMLTFRIWRDPFRHLLYDNLKDYESAAEKWLLDPERRKYHILGVGIDRSDSLLYEGIASHIRNLAPLFGDDRFNPNNNKLILLTKTANTHYLEEIPPRYRSNIVVGFSLNPEQIADLWEGKWPDTRERITPSITNRLAAPRFAQDLGYEIRIRIDPILIPSGWEDYYSYFISEIKSRGINFKYWTLGTYREKNSQLNNWRKH